MTDHQEKTEVLAGGDPRLQPRVGRYRLERRIGAGGMAEVFLARADGPLGFEKQVVIKKIRPQLSANPRFVDMFLREAKLLAGLDHPNIVRIIELDVDNSSGRGEYFLALEYLEGLSLREVAERHWAVGRPLPIEALIAIVADAALGLEHAHSFKDLRGTPANLVHRDVSPDNLFVTTSGTTKVIDFGIAKREGLDQLTQAGELKGKVPFMSPEHLQGLALDARADLFSVGVVLYWLFTGRRPFDGVTDVHTMKSILEDAPRAMRAMNPRIPVLLEDVVMSLLEKDRDRRMKSASALHDALLTLLVGIPRGAPRPAELVEAARRLPAVDHEVIPPGLAAIPATVWPDAGARPGDPPAPPDFSTVPTRARALPLGAPRTDESVPRPAKSNGASPTQKVPIARRGDTEESAPPPVTEVVDVRGAKLAAHVDVSTDEHKRPSQPSSGDAGEAGSFQQPSDPLIYVERVAVPSIHVAPHHALPPVDVDAQPTLLQLQAASLDSDISPTAPMLQKVKLDDADPASFGPDPQQIPMPAADEFFENLGRLDPRANAEQSPAVVHSELPPLADDRSRALPVFAGVVSAVVVVAAIGAALGVFRTDSRSDNTPPTVLTVPRFSDAGQAPLTVATAPSVDAGEVAVAVVVVVDAGSAAQNDAPEGAEDPPETGVPVDASHPRALKGRTVSLAAPTTVQWLGPSGEIYGMGNKVVRLGDGPRTITAVDLHRGARTRVVVDAHAKSVDYAKLPRQELQVRARPFAEVFLGKERLGITPLAPVDVVAGSYDVRFVYKKSAKEIITRTEHIDVKAQKPATLNVVMQKTATP